MKDTRKLAAAFITASAAVFAQQASAGFPFFDKFFGGNDDDYYDRYGPYNRYYGGPWGYGGPYGWGGGPYGYGGPYGWGGGPYGWGGPYGYGGYYGSQQPTQSQPAPPPTPE
jgi:hypothetical protein